MEKEGSAIIRLTQSIQSPTIIVGPPNFGMIGTIVTEFLISHLHMQSVGSISIPNLPAVVAVHQGQLLDPVGLFFAPTQNILAVHIAANVVGNEQVIVDALLQLSKQVNAARIVSVDGLLDEQSDDVPNVWFVTKDLELVKTFTSVGMDALADGIVSGPSALLLVANSSMPTVSLLASSHEKIADSAAAASLVAALDEWLHLSIDSSQLLDYVSKFEEKWRSILSDSQQTKEEKNKKYVSYVG